MAHQLDEKDSESYRKLARFYFSLGSDSSEMRAVEMLHQSGDINYQFPANAFLKSRKSDVIGSTALFLAESFKRKDIFELLLQKGADFTIKNAEGSTVLHQSVKYVLQNFKDINWRHGSFHAKVTDERISEFALAVLSAHVQSKNPTNPGDKNGITHFHVACLLDHSQAVEFFVNSGISIDHAVNDDSPILAGDTPLHIAAICGFLETTKILLKHGASTTVRNVKKMTPLQSVVSRNMEIVDWMHTQDRTIYCFSELKSEIDAKEKIITLLITENTGGTIDDAGFSCLHAAATLKNTSFVERLLERGIDVNHSVKMDSPVWPGYTALHFASHFSIEMVKLLVSKGANVKAKDAHGVTPFDMCVERFDLGNLHDILLSHATWKDIKLSDGTTKLVDLIYIMQDLARFTAFLGLEEPGVNVFVPHDSPLWPGCSVLHLAAMLTETIKIVDDYLYRDNDNDDSDCWSMGSDREKRLRKRPRHTMTSTPYIKRIQICLDADADVAARDARGSTPLHLAFRRQAFDAVRLMLEHHQETVNPTDKDNLSHVYIASYVGDESLAERLLSSSEVDANVPLSSSFRWHENESSFVRKYRSLGFKSGGSTPLHAAVIGGHKDIVSLLLKHSADVNASDENGLTPLHVIFSQHWNHDIADMLLASPNLKNCVFNGSLTHLHLAIFFSHRGAIERQLDNGANINAVIDVTPNDTFKVYDQWSHQPLAFMLEYAGCTPLHMAMGLHPRMDHQPYGQSDNARLLLQRGADMFIGNSVGRKVAYMSLTRRYLNTMNEDVEITHLQNDVASQRRMLEDSGITMLHIACWKVDVDAVAALLTGGADVNAQARPDSPVWPGWTPMHVLMLMAANCKIDSARIDAIMQMLLDNGADVTIANVEFETPLHLTEPGKLSVEIVSHVKYRSYADSPYAGLLLDRLKDDNANPCNIDGISYFHIACLRNDVKHVSRFLEQGVEVNKHINYFSNRYPGCTALHLAVNSESSCDAALGVAVVELLMNHGADINTQDIHGNTPLHLVVKNGSPCQALLELILSVGADLNATNMVGERAFDVLLRSEKFNSEDIKYFLRRGCQLNSYLTSSTSDPSEGYLGILSSNPLIKEIIKDWEEVLEIDGIGRTAIHNIVSINNSQVENYKKLIGILMSRGCDIDRQDKHGRTALHLAVRFLNFEAVSALIKLSADVNLIDEDGKTALARCFEYYAYSIETTSIFFGNDYPLQVTKCLAEYIYKMQLCGLEVHEDDIKTLADIPQSIKEDEDIVKICDEELKKAKTTKIGSSQLTVYDFLSNTCAWKALPVLLDRWPCPVDELFGTINNRLVCDEFPEFVDILGLQYRKFQNIKIQSNL